MLEFPVVATFEKKLRLQGFMRLSNNRGALCVVLSWSTYFVYQARRRVVVLWFGIGAVLVIVELVAMTAGFAWTETSAELIHSVYAKANMNRYLIVAAKKLAFLFLVFHVEACREWANTASLTVLAFLADPPVQHLRQSFGKHVAQLRISY